MVSFHCVLFLLFAPVSLFVSTDSPRLSPLTVGVLQKGTLWWRTQGWGMGEVIKGFVLRCTFSEKRGYSIVALRNVQVGGYF